MSKVTSVCGLLLIGVLTVSAYYARPMYDSSDYAFVRGSNGRSQMVRVMDRPDYNLAYVRGANGRTRLVPIYDRPDRPDNVLIATGRGNNQQFIVADTDNLIGFPHLYDSPAPMRGHTRASHRSSTVSHAPHQMHVVGRKKRHALLMPHVGLVNPLFPHPATALAIQATRARLLGGAFGLPFLPLRAGVLRGRGFPYRRASHSRKSKPAAATKSVPAVAPQYQPAPAVAPQFQPAPAVAPQFQPAPAAASQFQPAPAFAPQFQPAPAVAPQFQPAVAPQFQPAQAPQYQPFAQQAVDSAPIGQYNEVPMTTDFNMAPTPVRSASIMSGPDMFLGAQTDVYNGINDPTTFEYVSPDPRNQGTYQDFTGAGNINGPFGNGNINSIAGTVNVNDIIGSGNVNGVSGVGNIQDLTGPGSIYQDVTGTGVIYQDTLGAPNMIQDNFGNGMNSQGYFDNGMNSQGNIGNGMNSQGNIGNGMNSQGNIGNGMNSQGNIGNGMNSQGNVGNGINSQADIGAQSRFQSSSADMMSNGINVYSNDLNGGLFLDTPGSGSATGSTISGNNPGSRIGSIVSIDASGPPAASVFV